MEAGQTSRRNDRFWQAVDRATFSQPINTMPRSQAALRRHVMPAPWTICVVAEEPTPSRADQHPVGGSIATTASAPCARSRTNRAPVLSPHRQLQASCRAGRRPLNARSPPPNLVGQGQGLEISDLGAADLVLT